ncbi:MAG: hypothetical protein P5702_02125 [Limnospira sp. PMC 1291.21]|uniref:hypothetical protein n=1 Tax=unclassified Limnospira TaxID=2642885 RepID=UPI0028E183AC|nr:MULTISPECIES: hypothetical protein [unclassified Limnospira]MDT9176330.1 hypothetical protein [Limnospira sp. PMC 1238.20]MDT9191697.1 hypothetical protein [Limnospira sp. PMC 1245.20]MDT9201713.1 hypothetical protein [Limnospira sp. PMC 1243.20]MDT9207135.1 hypothetical protein [Limnospira sp. PMC 1252.20]MDT9212206.1 hypothetical protein [Limnospira sp. PMC 1256.20]
MKHPTCHILSLVLMVSSLGIGGCAISPPSQTAEVTPTGQLNPLPSPPIIQVMLPVNIKIELKAGGSGNHELLGFNPETRQLQLAGRSQGLPLTEVAKIERDRLTNQGLVVRGRPNIRGEDTLGTETWQVPLNALSSEEEKMMIRGQQAWENDELQGKLENQNDFDFLLDQLIPLSEDEMEIVVSKVRRVAPE